MKVLTLLRHARADWQPGSYSDDRLRPLNALGYKQLTTIADCLIQHMNSQPDLIVSSPAERTLTTARFVALRLSYAPEAIRIEEKIYDNTTEDLLEILDRLPDTLSHVLIVGHNPSLMSLVHKLSESESLVRFSPGDLYQGYFPIVSWTELRHTRTCMRCCHTPLF